MILGFAETAPQASPDEMMRLMHKIGDVILRDPDVEGFGSQTGSTGSAQTANTGRYFITLKPRDERKLTASQIIDRLRPQLAKVEGANLFLQPAQDINVGGRIARGSFQYTLQDTNIEELNEWSQKLLDKLRDAAAAHRRHQRSLGQRAEAARSPSIATRPRASAFPRRRSTTRSTTPSASARSPNISPS